MKIVLIRHYKTYGNELGRYIGTTDEELLPGTKRMEEVSYPIVEKLYVSPLRRCRETAELIYPGQTVTVVPDLRECSFGEFENKNYGELSGHPAYQRWIDSMGTLPFPGGEDAMKFRIRCVNAFLACVKEAKQQGVQSLGFVVHGGTIMSIMEKLGIENKSFYDYQVKNGHGYVVRLCEKVSGKEDYELVIEEVL